MLVYCKYFLHFPTNPELRPVLLQMIQIPRPECTISRTTQRDMGKLYDIMKEESDHLKYIDRGYLKTGGLHDTYSLDGWATRDIVGQHPATHLKCIYDTEGDVGRRFSSCVFDNLYFVVRGNKYYALRLQGSPISLAIYFSEFDFANGGG